MKKLILNKGFTLVEIMIAIAIIALLAAVAIPNLMRAKMSANDAVAVQTIRTVSNAAESFALAHSGNYPTAESDLVGDAPPYLNRSYCAATNSGYYIDCVFDIGSYTITSTPTVIGSTGTTIHTATTGGVIN